MASEALRKDLDLVWVVPMVGDVAYPVGQLVRGDPFEVCISNKRFYVEVFYHVVHNVTYVMLSSPVFRECTKGDPYPPRMDDMASAVYYSTFNQCTTIGCLGDQTLLTSQASRRRAGFSRCR